MKLYAVLMAGGKGTRFWPKSRESRPKQFLKFGTKGKTLFEESLARLRGLKNLEAICVVTDKAYRRQVKSLYPKVSDRHLFLEPVGRNTAPALAWAALCIQALTGEKNAVMLAMPCDHAISPVDVFQRDVQTAYQACRTSQSFVLFGITPDRPETGYGYIETDATDTSRTDGVRKIARFIEKPNSEKAKLLVEKPNVYWNSGIFMWPVKRFLTEFQRQQPEIFARLERVYQRLIAGKNIDALLKKEYAAIQAISIDYALMEHLTDGLMLLPARFAWNDLGDLNSLRLFFDQDRNENAVVAKKAFLKDCSNNTIETPKKAVACIGLKNMVVIDTDDVLLIAPASRLQEVKELVAQVKQEKAEKYL